MKVDISLYPRSSCTVRMSVQATLRWQSGTEYPIASDLSQKFFEIYYARYKGTQVTSPPAAFMKDCKVIGDNKCHRPEKNQELEITFASNAVNVSF